MSELAQTDRVGQMLEVDYKNRLELKKTNMYNSILLLIHDYNRYP